MNQEHVVNQLLYLEAKDPGKEYSSSLTAQEEWYIRNGNL
jgi:hypothetical protein